MGEKPLPEADGWTTEWPTEPGHYWVYGYPKSKYEPEPTMSLCEVIAIQHNGGTLLTYVINNYFIFRQLAGKVMFKPANIPSPPADFQRD